MEDTEKSDLKAQLAGSYVIEEEPDFWIVAKKESGQVVATILTASPYPEVRQQLAAAGVG